MLLPVLGLAAGAVALRAARERRGAYRNGYLQEWSAASSSPRPAIIFVSGFLTESDPEEPPDEAWRDGIVRVAEQHDFASYALHWPSSSWFDLLVGTASPTARSFGLLGEIVEWIAEPTYVAFGRTWKSAVEAADRVGTQPGRWMEAIGSRPLLLIGHSLGGRIVLKATAAARGKRILRTIALAPALEVSALTSAHCRGAHIFYSKNDAILKSVFPAGQMSDEHAVGFVGPRGARAKPARWWNVSTYAGTEIGHLDYSEHVDSMVGAAIGGVATLAVREGTDHASCVANFWLSTRFDGFATGAHV